MNYYFCTACLKKQPFSRCVHYTHPPNGCNKSFYEFVLNFPNQYLNNTAPQVKPPPMPSSSNIWPRLMRPLLMPSSNANGTDAAEVLPWFCTVRMTLSRLRPRCGTAIRRHRTPRVQEGSSLPAALRSRLPAPTRNSRSSRHRATRRRVAYSVPASRIRGQSSLACPHRACVVLAHRVCRGPAIRGLSIRPASHPSVRQPVVRARHRCLQWGRPLRVPYRPGSSLTWGSAR